MSEFFLELFSEEMPSKLQTNARKNLLLDLNKFLNSIEINKNYYRTGIHVKNPRYKINEA